MTLRELDTYFNRFLEKEKYASDVALNGIQIENSAPDTKEIKKIAFAVDACEATAKLAVDLEADVLFVHHGLFWGHSQPITGALYKRVSPFIKNDLALIAYHIPLDANDPYGNNYGIAKRIGLRQLEPFGTWHGMTIGVKGVLEDSMTIDELSQKAVRSLKMPTAIVRFGKKKISSVGIISGGASDEVEEAIKEGLDCYISGEFSHEQYHLAEEMKMNVIAGGHYETETVGVSLLKEKVESELGIECIFIDVPTGF